MQVVVLNSDCSGDPIKTSEQACHESIPAHCDK
jgi:hypothetical protein